MIGCLCVRYANTKKLRKAKKKRLTDKMARVFSELRPAAEIVRLIISQAPTKHAPSTARSVESSNAPTSRAMPSREKLARLGLARKSASMYCLRATKQASGSPVAFHEM